MRNPSGTHAMRQILLVVTAAAALAAAPQLPDVLFAQAPAAPGTQPPAGRQGGPAGGAPAGPGGQGVVGGVTPPAGQGGAGQGGAGRGGGRGGRGGAPAGPAPRNAAGRAILWSGDLKQKGVWTPRGVSITAPLASVANYGEKLAKLPFQPWARAVWEDREKHELEPHARCKASAMLRQFLTPYGTEIVELPEMQRIYIFDVGGPHTFRTIYMDGRSHPKNLTPSYYGHSIGWWEGDTLVVDSTG